MIPEGNPSERVKKKSIGEAVGASRARARAAVRRLAVGRKKIDYTSRFVRVILAQGPC